VIVLLSIVVLFATALLPLGALTVAPVARAQTSAGVDVAFSTYLGGNGGEVAAGVALDSAGNIYVAGRTRSTNFPLADPYQATPTRGGSDTNDIFVTKFSPDGRTLIHSTYIGGKELDRANAIAVDSQGQAVITGFTTSSDFPTANARFPTYTNQGDAFVLKLSADGKRLIYSTFLGGNGLDEGYGIAVDGTDNAYVTGQTQSASFPTANARDATGSNGTDAFVTKLSADGQTLVYSTYLGGPGASGFDPDTQGQSIALDATGSAYVLGWTASPSFPTTSGAFQRVLSGTRDVFVSKFSPDGMSLIYSTYYGGDGNEYGYGIAVDSSGAAYITGSTEASNSFPLVAPLQPTYGGGNGDAFVAKLKADGTSLLFSSFFGGGGTDRGSGIAVDSQGRAAITGQTFSFGSFPTIAPPWNASLGAGFVAQLQPGGQQLAFSTQFGGLRDTNPDRSEDGGLAVASDSAGHMVIAGQTQSSQFQVRNAFQQIFNGGGQDAAVMRFSGLGSDQVVFLPLIVAQ
jgi:hypothetical protein